MQAPQLQLEAPYRRSQSLEEHLGSYYRNLYSFRSKGLIKRSLVVVQADSGRYDWTDFEVPRHPDTGKSIGMNK